jgi:hypothetical protein
VRAAPNDRMNDTVGAMIRADRGRLAFAFCLLVVTAFSATSASAQLLEPRLYRNAPTGLNAVAFGYSFSNGTLAFDPALPIEGARGNGSVVPLAYVRTFGLFKKSAKLEVVLPVGWGHYEGFVDGEFRTRDLGGIADPSFRLSVNLFGAPALAARDFADYRQKTVVGVSLQVRPPLGSYEPDKLLNLGTNRWMFRPEIGASHQWRKWFFEIAATLWLFTKNDDFFGGQTLEQQRLSAFKGSIIRSFKPGLWAALSVGYGTGGKSIVDGIPKNTYQKNWRFGASVSLPVRPGQAIRLFAFSGVRQRVGNDSDVFGALYQITWLSKK